MAVRGLPAPRKCLGPCPLEGVSSEQGSIILFPLAFWVRVVFSKRSGHRGESHKVGGLEVVRMYKSDCNAP